MIWVIVIIAITRRFDFIEHGIELDTIIRSMKLKPQVFPLILILTRIFCVEIVQTCEITPNNITIN